MSNVVRGIQIALSIVLIFAVMLSDSKSSVKADYRGSENQAYFKPKGKEAFLSRVITLFGILFFVNAILMLLVQ